MPTANIRGATHAYDLTAQPALSVTEQLPTLVCIHGWMLSRAYWQPLVQQLSKHYCCLTYDLRGFGESTQSPTSEQSQYSNGPSLISANPQHTDYSLAAYATDLKDLLDALNLQNVWLLGHSLGGSIALWAAHLFPQQIKGVICINAGGGIFIPDEFEKFRTAGQQMVKFRPAWLRSLPLLPQAFARMMVHQPLSPNWGKLRLYDFIRADRQAAEGALLESTTQAEVHQLPQVVSQLQQPVHFITATEDHIMPPRYVRYLASFHPQFEEGETITELSECGHIAMLEKSEEVADIVSFVIETHNNRTNSSGASDGNTLKERSRHYTGHRTGHPTGHVKDFEQAQAEATS